LASPISQFVILSLSLSLSLSISDAGDFCTCSPWAWLFNLVFGMGIPFKLEALQVGAVLVIVIVNVIEAPIGHS